MRHSQNGWKKRRELAGAKFSDRFSLALGRENLYLSREFDLGKNINQSMNRTPKVFASRPRRRFFLTYSFFGKCRPQFWPGIAVDLLQCFAANCLYGGRTRL